MLPTNFLLVNQNISKTCKIFNRNTADINLVAVSKQVLAEKIIEAIGLGCKIFGENYLQEAQEKWPQIRQNFPEIKLHFIGNFQSNKAKEVVALFDCIESLASENQAVALKKEMQKQDKKPEIFVQVNIGEESQKSGIMPQKLDEFLQFCRNLELEISGLMAIPPLNYEPSPYFALLAKMAKENFLKDLSMGMSSDYEDAIALGATHIRLGTALFGERVLK